MTESVTLLHSSVPRLIDFVYQLPVPGLWARLFGATPGGLCRHDGDERAVLLWRRADIWSEPEQLVANRLADGDYLRPGRLWVDRGNGLEAEHIEPVADATGAMLRIAGMGALHLALQTRLHADASGELRLRIAWQCAAVDWSLVIVHTRAEYHDGLRGDGHALVIALEDLALVPPGTEAIKPWSKRLLLGQLGRGAWAFGHADPGFDKANEDLLAIDFGTYETMAAILSRGSRKVRILPHPEPWFRQAIEVTPGAAAAGPHCRRALGADELPAPVRRHRGAPPPQRLGMPSQGLHIPPTMRGHDLFDEVALGDECDRLIEREPGLLDAFRPCPKLFLATINNSEEDPAADTRTTDRRVVIGFLADMLNSVAAVQIAAQDARVLEQKATAQRRAVRPILYSFPVSLTQAQLDDLGHSFRAGLADSQLARSVPGGGKRLEAAVDEASAAALGVFFHSAANLPIRQILDAHGPYATRPRTDHARELDVLSIDLGGGTSDLVLLHVGKDRQRPGWRVSITEAFGVPRAGLAVTMRIAARLKQLIAQTVRRQRDDDAFVHARKLLNTNFAFHPPGAVRPNDISEHQWGVAAQRRERTMAWYHLAERIKCGLCGDDAASSWPITAADLRPLGLGELGDLGEIRFPREELEQITYQTFASVLRKIREWLGVHTVDLVVLAGRSFRLPGLRPRLEDLLREYNRRVTAEARLRHRRIRRHDIVDLEWLEEHYGHLDLQEVGEGRIARDKALVAAGLIQRQSLLDNPTAGERLRTAMISSARRNRYIGLAEKAMAGEGRNFVISDRHMVAIADEEMVRPEEDIRVPIAPGATGFFLKINFLGPGPLEGEDAVDPPLSLARIAIEDDESDDEHELESLELIFRQRTASQVELHGIATRRRHADPVESRERVVDGPMTSVASDGVTVQMDEQLIFDDFRLDGIISPDIDVDDIGGAVPVFGDEMPV